jgi:putative flippase GtrA
MRITKKLVTEVALFLIVGVTSLLIDLVVTTSLYHLLHLPAFLASAIGFLSAFFFNFPMNRKKVFKHTIHDRFGIKVQIAFYAALSVFNLFATSAIVELLVWLGIDISVTKILVTILIAIWNFLLFKFLIFSKKPAVENQS